jgi:hypothetical protein
MASLVLWVLANYSEHRHATPKINIVNDYNALQQFFRVSSESGPFSICNEPTLRLPFILLGSAMSFLDMTKNAAATAVDKTKDVAGAVADTAKNAVQAVAESTSPVTAPVVEGVKSAASGVGAVAAAIGGTVVAAAEKATGVDLNKDGKVG